MPKSKNTPEALRIALKKLEGIQELADGDGFLARFEEGVSADPTENMSPEDAAKWKRQNEEHRDKFKKSAWMQPGKWYKLPAFQDGTTVYFFSVEEQKNGGMSGISALHDPGSRRRPKARKESVPKMDRGRYKEVSENEVPANVSGAIKARTASSNRAAYCIESDLMDLGIMAEGCPENLDESECKEWEANTDKYKDQFKGAAKIVDPAKPIRLTPKEIARASEGWTVAVRPQAGGGYMVAVVRADSGKPFLHPEIVEDRSQIQPSVRSQLRMLSKMGVGGMAEASRFRWKSADLDPTDRSEAETPDIAATKMPTLGEALEDLGQLAVQDPDEAKVIAEDKPKVGLSDMTVGQPTFVLTASLDEALAAMGHLGNGAGVEMDAPPAVCVEEIAADPVNEDAEAACGVFEVDPRARLSNAEIELGRLARFPEGESVDVPAYLREKGNAEAAKKWEEEHDKNKDKFKTATRVRLTTKLARHQLRQKKGTEFVNLWAAVADRKDLLAASDQPGARTHKFWEAKPRIRDIDFEVIPLKGVPIDLAMDFADHGTRAQVYPTGAAAWKDARKFAPPSMRVAGMEKIQEPEEEEKESKTAASGLYGFTKRVQSDCETASRKLQKAAARIARDAYNKNADVAPFLSTHMKRANSLPAKILTAAMKDLGPKIAKEAVWDGWDQEMPVQVVSARGVEVFQNLHMAKQRYPELNPESDGPNFTGATQGEVNGKPAIRFETHEIDQRGLSKAAMDKRDWGLYGFRSKTANLGIRACSDLREAAGHIASGLHGRKAASHEHITGFLKQHAKEAKCLYSRMLHASYPDADMKCASSPPASVAEWLSWED